MIVRKLTKDEWREFSERAHLLVFNETISSQKEFIDFALMSGCEGVPYAYMTCREIDPGVVYLKYGGAFPESRGTANSFRAYKAMLDFLAKEFDRGFTLIENTNTSMLKFAMACGWRITGVRVFDGDVMVEHTIKFKEV